MSNGEHSFTSTGRMRHATYSEVSKWVSTAWKTVSEQIIKSGFVKSGIIKSIEDHDDLSDDSDNEEENDLPHEICQLFITDSEDDNFDGFQ